MSKKKSAAWGRKTTGHISKGVMNYDRLAQFGRGGGKKQKPLSDPIKERMRQIDAKHEQRRKGVKFVLK